MIDYLRGFEIQLQRKISLETLKTGTRLRVWRSSIRHTKGESEGTDDAVPMGTGDGNVLGVRSKAFSGTRENQTGRHKPFSG